MVDTTAPTPTIAPVSKALTMRWTEQQYAQMPTLALGELGGDLTLQAWVYIGGTQWNHARILDFGNAAANNNLWLGFFGGKLRFEAFNNATSLINLTAPDTFAVTQWNHVAVTVTSAQVVTLYINGNAVATGVASQAINAATRNLNYLGKSNWPDPYYDGRLADVRVYNDARTPAEILADMAGGTPGDNLVMGYSFDGSTAAMSGASKTTSATLLSNNGSPTAHTEGAFEPLTFSADSGPSQKDFITNTATQTLSGKYSAALASDEDVYVSLNNASSWILAQKDNNTLTWTLANAVLNAGADGTNTVRVKVMDAAGNNNLVYTDANIQYTLDTAAPAAPSLSLATDSGTSNSDSLTNVATVNVTGLVAGASWQYQVGGGSWTAGTGTSFAATAGSNTYAVRQTDLAGNLGAASSAVTYNYDATGPTVSSVAITSATGIQNNRLNVGDVVGVTVTMSEATTVTGTPTLGLKIGGTTVQASYASGSGTNALVFNYTILAAQTDADGISVDLNSLALAGGTLKDAAGNNATLTHSAVADNASFLVDTTAPAAPSLSLATDSGTSNSDSLTNVATVNVSGLEAGATWEYQVGSGSWTAGTGTSFTATAGSNTYAVRQTDAAGNLGTASSAVTYNYDANGPTVSGVAITGATGRQNNTLNAGDVVSVTVTMNEATTVSGTPTLGLNIGGTTVQASYASGSGTTALMFNYTIVNGDLDTDGISIAANSLALAGGTLKDAADNDAVLTHALQTNNSGYKVDTSSPTATLMTTNDFLDNFDAGNVNNWDVHGAATGNTTSVIINNGQVNAVDAFRILIKDFSLIFNYSYTASFDYTSSNAGTKLILSNHTSYGSPAVATSDALAASGSVSFKFTAVRNGIVIAYDSTTPLFTGTIDNFRLVQNPFQNTSSVRLQSNDTGTAYLVHSSVSVTDLNSITTANDALWNSNNVTANTTTQMSLSGLQDGTYRLYTVDAAGNMSSATTNTVVVSASATPLILDLNGDGVRTTDVAHGVLFDVNDTGSPVHTGWVDAHDGLLVLDLNLDGRIHSGAELFGSGTTLASTGGKAADGYAALRAYDLNADGVINALDAVFQNLQVWQDNNTDGVSDAGELHSLASLGIASLDLNALAGAQVDNGNTLALVSSWTDSQGQSHQMADVWFSTTAPDKPMVLLDHSAQVQAVL